MSMHYGNINMAREDEKGNIYINEDAQNRHDVTTGTQRSETMRQQTPRHTGDYLSASIYRAAKVCLVLLCVALLTAVIVLGVHIKTKSTNHKQVTNQLLSNITNLTEETHQLLTDKTNLINERDGLMSNNNELLKERDALRQVFFPEYSMYYLSTHCNLSNGWHYHQYSFYYFSSEKKNWTESRRYCTERGADLIIINNKEEQDFVQNKKSYGTHFWIGLTDSDEEGTWKWVDGSTPTFRFWASNEPRGQQRENCALIYTSNWADYPCGDTFRWIFLTAEFSSSPNHVNQLINVFMNATNFQLNKEPPGRCIFCDIHRKVLPHG
ncbi:hypothetical protein Q8A67_000055 [Cirrhinus molitorella]|uniref:C-type lectin domain-containing protein n=1 Tax=Cirrhinus molitorella TaxID=172907 RepID=A0AA88Q949_9TELE|nr:hypothetical protein Q8A67_000055 [Cirrhinus molitorella]